MAEKGNKNIVNYSVFGLYVFIGGMMIFLSIANFLRDEINIYLRYFAFIGFFITGSLFLVNGIIFLKKFLKNDEDA